MSFTDAPYSYAPGANRLLGPVNLSSNPAYNFQATSGYVQDATEFSKGESYYALFKEETNPPAPPSQAPGVPYFVAGKTETSITINFNAEGVTGNPPPSFYVLYGTTTSPETLFPAFVTTGTVYGANVTGLTANTTYYFKSVAKNSQGEEISAVSVGVTTDGPGGTPPSGPPTVPVVSGTPTEDSITVTFDAAGITGNPTPTYSILVGPNTTPTQPVAATLVSGTTYTATVSALNPATTYYFKSVAANGNAPDQVSALSAGIATAGTPPPPAQLDTFLNVVFLITLPNSGVWTINTSDNLGISNFYLTGAGAGTIRGAGPSAAQTIANCLSYKQKGKLIVSWGGATGVLNAMLPTAQSATDFCNTVWNVLFGAAAPNALNWSNAAWGGGATPLFFDGLDLDWESAISDGAIISAFMTQWIANVAAYGGAVGKKYLNAAPQTPNTWLNAPSTSPFTNNLVNIPFAGSQSALSTIAPGFLASSALLAPGFLKAIDNVFPQIYNQASVYLTNPDGSYNVNFTQQMAQWAYLVMKARRAGGNTKMVWAFSSTDATTPDWTAANAAQLNAAIELINPIVSAQLIADGGAGCVATDWSKGFGMWNSPSANTVVASVFASGSAISLNNMAGESAILYCNASSVGDAPGWQDPPLPYTDARTA